MEGIIIREMSHDHLRRVHAIEKQCFTSPWTFSSFQYELGRKDTILNIAVMNNTIVGYVCIRTILDTTQVMNLTVHPEFRRRSIGSTLFLNALQELKYSGVEITHVTLEVRASNIPAITLYEKAGFQITGRRVGYYQKPCEDAVIMGLEIGE